MLPINQTAPDFELPALIDGVKKRFRLSEYVGKQNIVLAFYPLNWEPVSTQQMIRYQVERREFTTRETEVVGISVDSIMNTTAWEREIGPFDFPLCSDFWPHGEVSRKYGVLREAEPLAGSSERALFVISRDSRIALSKTYPPDQAPDIQEVFDSLTRVLRER